MTFLKISVPVYKKNAWDNLEKDGRVEVSSEVDSLSEGYQFLKLEIDKLLSELNAQNRLSCYTFKPLTIQVRCVS